MPCANIIREIEVKKTGRVSQLLGLFDIDDANKSRHEMNVDIPIENINWSVGVIVGASGSGKTTIAREMFGDRIIDGFDWDNRLSVIDCFGKEHGIKDITTCLSSVGFSSPPLWLRPYHVLSNGEKFRVTLARAILDSNDMFLIDEFTSVVDRAVAKIGSFSFQKAIRKSNKKFIAISCHYDILEWLQPDWVFNVDTLEFKDTRGLLRRPDIEIVIKKVHTCYWELFKKYHYLSSAIHKAAQCYAAFINNKPVAFSAVLPFPHPIAPGYREHRTVCLPDYQGAGIGNTLSDFVASIYYCKKTYTSATGNPAMINYRNKSQKWQMIKKPSFSNNSNSRLKSKSFNKTVANNRYTTSFKYVGEKDFLSANGFEVLNKQ